MRFSSDSEDTLNTNEFKSAALKRVNALNSFIRDMEDFAKIYNIDVHTEKLYITACAQRDVLQELLEMKKT